MNIYRRCFCTFLSVCKFLQAFFICASSTQYKKGKGLFNLDYFLSKRLPILFTALPDRQQDSSKKGFTLLELMMVIAIIGTLAAIAIPNYIGYRQKALYSSTLQTMRTIEKELTVFNLEKGYFPETLAEAGLGNLRDPWGNPFQYLNIQTVKGVGKVRKDHSLHPLNTDYDLYSMGPDGKSVPPLTGKSSKDDIIRANNGAFLGKGSDY